VSKEETLQILEPIASILSIRLDMVELLEAAEEFKGEFLLSEVSRFFGRLSRSRSNFLKKLMSYVYGKSTFISNIRYL